MGGHQAIGGVPHEGDCGVLVPSSPSLSSHEVGGSALLHTPAPTRGLSPGSARSRAATSRTASQNKPFLFLCKSVISGICYGDGKLTHTHISIKTHYGNERGTFLMKQFQNLPNPWPHE